VSATTAPTGTRAGSDTRSAATRAFWRSPAIAPDLWLLAVSLAAGLGTARLTQAPAAIHVLGPITATVVAGHLAVSVARRLRVTVGVALAAGVVVVVLATIWGQLASATRYGIPTPGTWRTLVSKFDAAGAVIRSHPTPVPPTPEIVLCIATGAGLVAVIARSLWARQEARGVGPLPVLVPAFGLFCYTALLSSQVDRVAGGVAFLVCALAFVITGDRAARGAVTVASTPPGQRGVAIPIGRRVAHAGTANIPAVFAAALAVVVPLAASPALSTLRVSALPFGEPGGRPDGAGLALGPGAAGDGGGLPGGTGGGPAYAGVRAIDLVDNLKAVLVNRTTEVMFDAVTPVPTYWQVAVLTRFDGTSWLPDRITQAAAQSDPLLPPSRVSDLPALPEPQPTSTFKARVTIGGLQSTLLPLPPTTVSVNTPVDLVPGFGGLQAVEAAPGLTYVAVARMPANTAKAPHGAGPGASDTKGTVAASSLAPYLGLPSEPAAVVALAHQIVAGANGPGAQAAALARWFDTGRYRYTLSPAVPAGSNPLQSFLFTTRAGFCQQFAAAFSVLARIDGLPTRVAVGFTTGTSRGHGGYRITGADAHVWPEVYLGPSTGWTSFEPTPSSSGEPTGVGVNSGSRSSTQGSGTRSTATTATTLASLRHPFLPNVAAPSTVPTRLHGNALIVGSTRGSWTGALKIAAGLVALAALIALAGLWVRRLLTGDRAPLERFGRRRRRRLPRPAADPTAEVLARWREAEKALERARLGRRPSETLDEHASRLRSLAGAKWLLPYRPVIDSPTTDGGSSPALRPEDDEVTIDASIDAYGRLTVLAVRASYASDPCTSRDADDAAVLGDLVRAGLSSPTRRRVPSTVARG
jgi:hypothetical protein